MYRLLIVDDEPIIVDGMYDLFLNNDHLILDVYKAYSAKQAIDWLNRAKIDVVITDIKMPGISGLQLLKEIRQRWPLCKVIFLTAYSEFEYAYTAMRYNAVNYILKTEGEEAIVNAVEECITEIEKSVNIEEITNKAKQQMFNVMPILQREYLMDLLNAENFINKDVQQQFNKLQIPLNIDHQVLLLVGRIDNYLSNTLPSEKTQFFSEINGIFQNYIEQFVNSFYIPWEKDKLVWFIQPYSTMENGNDCATWLNTTHFIKGALETIQDICKNSLNISLSFVIDDKPSLWHNVSNRFFFLKQIICYQLNNKDEMVLLDSSFFNHEFVKYTSSEQQLYDLKFNLKLESLKAYLETGQNKEFFKSLSEITECIINQNDDYYKIEMYYSICLIFISYINRYGIKEKIETQININNLLSTGEIIDIKKSIDYLYKLGEVIFSCQNNEHLKKIEFLMISNVNKYINENLDKDLSLVTLSENVYLNPSYLSRIYKQITGINLSDYVRNIRISKAKELLQNNSLKIHEIAKSVGYESAAYFTRIFKNTTNLTPQEYRDAILKSKSLLNKKAD